MSLAIRDAGNVRRTIASLKMRDAGGTLRTVTQLKMRDANNVLRTIFSSLGASVNPQNVEGFANSTSTVAVTTDQATASPVGGAAPFTYAWEAVSSPGWTILSPAAASSRFGINVAPGATEQGNFRCKITDASGAEAYTPQVAALATNLGGGL